MVKLLPFLALTALLTRVRAMKDYAVGVGGSDITKPNQAGGTATPHPPEQKCS